MFTPPTMQTHAVMLQKLTEVNINHTMASLLHFVVQTCVVESPDGVCPHISASHVD